MRNINVEIRFLKKELNLKKGDVIYVLSHKKKMSILGRILDLATDGAVDLIHSYQGGAYRYLVATTQKGTIYQVFGNNQIEKVSDIEPWTIEQKDNFKTTTINDIRYKSIRKVLVE